MKRHLLLLLAAAPLHAGTRSSADYTFTTDTNDAAGRRTASADYTNDGSLGGIGGISNAVPDEVVKHSYIGQLYDPAGLTLTSASPSVDETMTVQLGALLTMDDGSFLPLAATDVQWNGGNWFSIAPDGLATAGAVYEHTATSVSGLHAGSTAVLDLLIRNQLPDNYGIYAGDGIYDDWQVQYFGVNNPSAGPGRDPDADGFDNLFEYHACLIPTDPLSKFNISLATLEDGSHAITFSPRLPGCRYRLAASSDLILWEAVAGTTILNAGPRQTIIEPASASLRRFYRVDVQRE